jgi:hypothetical protein
MAAAGIKGDPFLNRKIICATGIETLFYMEFKNV